MKCIITLLISTCSLLNGFGQSKKFDQLLKLSALQKKPILVIVKNNNLNVDYTMSVSEDEAENARQRESIERLVRMETDINNDVPLKDSEVNKVVKENFILYRMSADSSEYEKFISRYNIEYKNVPEYIVVSSKEYLLSDGIFNKNSRDYSNRNSAYRLSNAAKTNKLIEDVFSRFSPKSTKEDYKAISFYLAEIERPIAIDIAKKFFNNASERQRTDSLLYKNFSFLNEGEINYIDSFYILNYKKNAGKIAYNHYRYFFYLFTRKYNALYYRMQDKQGKLFDQFISLKPLMDTCIKYYPLAMSISHERFELNSSTKMWKPVISSGCINALMRDIEIFLNFNTDSVCGLFKQRTSSLYSDRECLMNESDYLYSYSRGLSGDISTLKYYVRKKNTQDPERITEQYLNDLGKKINEKEKKLRDQLRQSLR